MKISYEGFCYNKKKKSICNLLHVYKSNKKTKIYYSPINTAVFMQNIEVIVI